VHVVDAAGNPIIIRALLEYAINDPAALYIATAGDVRVLFNQAEQVVREVCTHLPLLGEKVRRRRRRRVWGGRKLRGGT
jgi:regulator of protease activity HflC (stomatin/prohibitin superfamily)